MSNLQVIARRCPVMSKALAVQSVRYRAASTVAGAATPAPAATAGACKHATMATAGMPKLNIHQKRTYVVPSKPVCIHATSKVPAQADSLESVHFKAGVYDTSKGICPHGAAAMKAASEAATMPFIRKRAPLAPAPAMATATTTATVGKPFNYEAFYQAELDKKHKDKSYRYFNNINRLAKNFPKAHMETEEKIVTVFCSNDYVCPP